MRYLIRILIILALVLSSVGFIPLTSVRLASAQVSPYPFWLKWSQWGAPGGGMGFVVGDLYHTGHEEDIVSSGNNYTVALNGTDAVLSHDRRIFWSVSTPGLGDTTQPQMADLNDDGYLEIVVPIVGPPAGFYILAHDGTILQPVIPIAWGGRCDNGPVIADVDGSGYPTIFFASMTFVESTDEANSTGVLASYKYNSSTQKYEKVAQTKLWHPCSGGLSIADANHDGQFEIFMGDRDMYMVAGTDREVVDRGYGGGVIAFWASNLTEIWRHPDSLVSSAKPILADVTGDDDLEVIVTLQRGGLAVLDSKDGNPINETQYLRGNNGNPVSGHYQSSVYDINHDGYLDILMADGDHDITHDMVVWDLVKWREVARVPSILSPADYTYFPNDSSFAARVFTGVGQMLFGPQIADVTGDGLMDIVATNYTNLFVFDGNHDPSLDGTYPVTWVSGNLTSLENLRANALLYPVMADADGDGYMEIIVKSQGGWVYCFGTHGTAPYPMPRAEVQFYSELRQGVAEYVPPALELSRSVPIVSNLSPNDWQRLVPVNTSQLSFTLRDYQNNSMNYTVTTSPNIGSDSRAGVSDGDYTASISGLDYSTTYTWHVQVTDGTSWNNQTYFFTTEFAPRANTAPTQSNPLLKKSRRNLVATNQSTFDLDGDKVTNIYQWVLNSVSTTNLLMSFDTMNQIFVEDYSGYGNNGKIVGDVAWVSNGLVGGAYQFNKGYIVVDSSNTLDGNNTWSEMSAELWVYVSPNQGGLQTRILFKQPVYELGLKSSGILFVGVWTYEQGANATIANYVQVSTLNRLSTSTWHHVAFTYLSGDGLKLYVDGQLVDSAPHSGVIQRSIQPLYIGWFNYFRGMIDEVQIYPKRLSPQQIQQDYLQSRNGATSSSTIVSQEIQKGDVWNCVVTPNDSFIDGITKGQDTTPPQTTNNYDGHWHTANFNIPLTATDNETGVLDTYYKINNGAQESMIWSGQPSITTEGANNTLEYWSVDNAGNEESHHILAGIKLDKTRPSGSFVINNNAEYATSTSVTLTLTAIDNLSGVYQVRCSNDGVWDSELWENFSVAKAWNLAPGDGTKTVYYQIEDNAGLNSTTYSATIILDTAPPNGSTKINNGANYTTTTIVALNLSANDETSGVADMCFSNDNITFTDWQAFANSISWTLQEGDGTKTVYYQMRDKAGLISTYSDTIILDTLPPTGSISINGGATYTNSSSIVLTLSAKDVTSTVAQVHFSNDNITWTPWEAYSVSKAWTLTTGDGTKTVYVQYVDKAGLNSLIYQNTTILDTKKPIANAGTNQTVEAHVPVVLNASASTDEIDIANYTWTFTDETQKTLTGKNQTYTFTTPGTYPVKLTVQDPARNTATTMITITVLPAPGLPPMGVIAAAIALIGIVALVSAPMVIRHLRKKKNTTGNQKQV